MRSKVKRWGMGEDKLARVSRGMLDPTALLWSRLHQCSDLGGGDDDCGFSDGSANRIVLGADVVTRPRSDCGFETRKSRAIIASAFSLKMSL